MKQRATRTTRTKRNAAAKPAALRDHGRVHVSPLGTVDRIDYTVGREKRFHAFKKKTTLYTTHDKKQLIISPVKVRGGNIHD